jgi:transcriptional regulator with XRE-family HTH domain
MSQRVSVQRQRIGPAIRKLRRTNDLTLDDLASQAGISASHLSRLERGQTLPSFTVLAQIAHVLGASVDEFVQLEQDVTALDTEFGGSLAQLGFSDEVQRELLSSSIELRRELMASLRALAAVPITSKQAQDNAVRATTEQGLTGASGALNRIIRSSGMSPVAFARALFWVSTQPGDKRMVVAEPGLIGAAGSTVIDVYHALAGDEPLDPMVAAWWVSNQPDSARGQTRSIVQRDVLQRFLRNGGWVKGQPTFQSAQIQQGANYLLDLISRGTLLIAITDRQAGDLNILITDDGDVLLESNRYRATEGERARLGLLIRDPASARVFAERFDALWDEIPPEEKDPFRANAWIREHMASSRN